jgi:hypothetical protein
MWTFGRTDAPKTSRLWCSFPKLPFNWPIPIYNSPKSVTAHHNFTDSSSHDFENLADNLMGCWAAIPTETLLPDLYYIMHGPLLIILKVAPNLQASPFICRFVMPATIRQKKTDRQTQTTQLLTTMIKSRRTRWTSRMAGIVMNKNACSLLVN